MMADREDLVRSRKDAVHQNEEVGEGAQSGEEEAEEDVLVPSKKRPSTQDDEIRTKDSWTPKKHRIVMDDTIVSCSCPLR